MKKAGYITTLWNNPKDWEKANITAFVITLRQAVESKNRKA